MLKAIKKAQCNKSLELEKGFKIPFTHDIPTFFYRCANDHTWTSIFMSDTCVNIHGYTREQIDSHEIHYGEIIKDVDREMVWTTIQDALRKHVPFQLIYQLNAANGENKIVFERGEGVFDSSNTLVELTGFISDITSFYNAEEMSYLQELTICAQEINEFLNKNSKDRKVRFRILSVREVETLIHLCQGKTMKEIGIDMGISPRTVEMNIRHAKQKLSCFSQAELRKLLFMTELGKKLIVSLK